MIPKRYVQHISGQGEKWEVDNEDAYVMRGRNENIVCWLPKSEYRLCEQPEEWEDVTENVDYCGNLAFAHRKAGKFGDEIVTDDKGYRFTKIDGLHNGPVFIVERRKS